MINPDDIKVEINWRDLKWIFENLETIIRCTRIILKETFDIVSDRKKDKEVLEKDGLKNEALWVKKNFSDILDILQENPPELNMGLEPLDEDENPTGRKKTKEDLDFEKMLTGVCKIYAINVIMNLLEKFPIPEGNHLN